MPTYNVVCQTCHDSGDVRLTFQDYDKLKAGDITLQCNSCDTGTCSIAFDPSSVQFVLKDGESGGWASKAIKENAYRARHRQHMAKKERDHVFKPKLQPNFRGIETDTWRDAKEFARTETAKDHGIKVGNETAKTFDALVHKEKQ